MSERTDAKPKRKVGRPPNNQWQWEFALNEATARISGRSYHSLFKDTVTRELGLYEDRFFDHQVPVTTVMRRYYDIRKKFLQTAETDSPHPICDPEMEQMIGHLTELLRTAK